MDIKTYLSEKKKLIDAELQAILASEDMPVESLAEGAHRAVLPGGKRIRPILTLASFEAVGGDCPQIVRIASCVELIHSFSLVHDDLPAMDNSDLRRGLPTVHKVVGEGMAVLVGDMLLALPFQTLAELPGVEDDKRNRLIGELARACGSSGLAGGQALDLESEQKSVTEATARDIARRKTGALIEASVALGAIAGDASEETFQKLKEYGSSVGLAFQVTDDLLDAEGEQEILGKPVRADEEKGKAAYPSLVGGKRARQVAEELTRQAIGCLTDLGEKAQPLREIAHLLLRRKG
ncbi:polyprenyl synthetase family protein [bacterium]|nr:polyprenyl synthetase family protein [bacterium]